MLEVVGERELQRMYAAMQEKVPEETIRDLNNRVEDLRGILEGTMENQQVITRYNQTEEDLLKEQTLLEEAKIIHDGVENSMAGRRANW